LVDYRPGPPSGAFVTITEQDVRHLAKLASLALDDRRLAVATAELDHIVAYVQQLQAVDTTGVLPIANVAGAVSITRGDAPGMMLSQAEVLALAPAKGVDAILVPKVVER